MLMDLMTQIQNDLFMLGLDEQSAGTDLVENIETVEDMYWWNQWFEANGFPQNVVKTYGDLNWLAGLLGIPYDSTGERLPKFSAQPIAPTVTTPVGG